MRSNIDGMKNTWFKVVSLVAMGVGTTLYFTSRELPVEPVQDTPTGRAAFELKRLADPETGEIPKNIRMRELAYASQLPKSSGRRSSNSLTFSHTGPYNVGGRTRAVAIDVANPTTYFAGGVSGGLWRTTDEGDNWTRVTATEDHAAVSTIAQDTRAGKTNVWYYGSGETVGNSASKSFSATYRGGGMYKSTDNGLTWNLIASTATLPHKSSNWDAIFKVAIDPSETTNDEVYAAIEDGIMRSVDGGITWTNVLGGSFNTSFVDLAITSTGVVYAVFSDDAGTEAGFWRSPDGINWTQITPAGFPSNHERTVLAVAPSNENLVFFFSGTPNAGKSGHSLWKYQYSSGSGAGSGGFWTNLSNNLPSDSFWSGLELFNGYCQVIGVKPDNENAIFLGGTNLFRSLNGFTGTNSTRQIGGYNVDGDPNYNTRQGKQHPDQHAVVFHPTDPNIMLSTSDGGVHRTTNCVQNNIQWTSVNNGYVTTQFYAIAIDHATDGSEEIIGGLQDNGTYYTNSTSSTADWATVRGGDGAYVAIEDGGAVKYSSTQYANVEGMIINNGVVQGQFDVMPPSRPGGQGSGFLFVHPFTLDPADNNIMYLPYRNEIWRNDNLAAAQSFNLTPWSMLGTLPGSTNITAIAASKAPQGTVYVGTGNRTIYRIDNANTAIAPTITDITAGIENGGYTSCIGIDPADAQRVIVVYSNYNTRSLWYTEDGGDSWVDIEGNLKGTTDPGVPPQLSHLSDGPSTRWVEIVPTDSGNTYFLGTSVGLYSTTELNGDSTVWTQEGASVIGNVIVDMIDYREVDRFLAIGTHGNGIFHTNLPDNSGPGVGIADQSAIEASVGLKNFPNPVQTSTQVAYTLPRKMSVKLTLFDQAGRKIKTLDKGYKEAGANLTEIDMNDLPSGIYYYNLKADLINITKPLVKQ